MNKQEAKFILDPATSALLEGSLHEIRQVLWHFGDRENGVPSGGFTETLLIAMGKADADNRFRMRVAFPSLAVPFQLVQDRLDGKDILVAFLEEK